MVLYGLNETLKSHKSLQKGANFKILSPALKGRMEKSLMPQKMTAVMLSKQQ